MDGGGRVVMMIMNTPDEMDEGGAEKLSVSPKAKRIASPRWSKHETLVMWTNGTLCPRLAELLASTEMARCAGRDGSICSPSSKRSVTGARAATGWTISGICRVTRGGRRSCQLCLITKSTWPWSLSPQGSRGCYRTVSKAAALACTTPPPPPPPTTTTTMMACFRRLIRMDSRWPRTCSWTMDCFRLSPELWCMQMGMNWDHLQRRHCFTQVYKQSSYLLACMACGPSVVSLLKWTRMFEWNMARFLIEDRH